MNVSNRYVIATLIAITCASNAFGMFYCKKATYSDQAITVQKTTSARPFTAKMITKPLSNTTLDEKQSNNDKQMTKAQFIAILLEADSIANQPLKLIKFFKKLSPQEREAFMAFAAEKIEQNNQEIHTLLTQAPNSRERQGHGKNTISYGKILLCSSHAILQSVREPSELDAQTTHEFTVGNVKIITN